MYYYTFDLKVNEYPWMAGLKYLGRDKQLLYSVTYKGKDNQQLCTLTKTKVSISSLCTVSNSKVRITSNSVLCQIQC